MLLTLLLFLVHVTKKRRHYSRHPWLAANAQFLVPLNMEKEEIPIEIKARSVLIKGDIFRTIGNLI